MLSQNTLGTSWFPIEGGTFLNPILDLCALNRYLGKYRFRMLTHTSLLCLLHQRDWFTSLNLKDVYFHVLIYPPHHRFLWSSFQGVCYEDRMLPFGLSPSPRVYVHCTKAAIAPLRWQCIHLVRYLDDWLLLAKSEQEAAVQTRMLVQHLQDLGFTII